MHNKLTKERRVFLAMEPAGRREVRLALAAGLVSFAFFLAAVPFATRPLARVPAFIPAYESALVVTDLVIAVLLFSQFNVLRSWPLYVLANGYLFTAGIALCHALSFPGVFSPTGLLGASSQSTAWLYMFWHGGFPLFVIAYKLLKATRGPAVRPTGRGIGRVILVGVAAVVALVGGLTLVATTSDRFLPMLILEDTFTPTMTWVVSGVWGLSFVALLVMWWRVPHTILDLWMIVVMCAWLFDIALSAVFNAARFDLGWYAGRIYGLVAASFLIIALLIETSKNYARLVELSAELSASNHSLEQQSLHDGLTGLANRRYFDKYLSDQLSVARRHHRTLALILCDIDSFKSFNDCYGHPAGDECLKQVAAALRSCCRRPADMVARYGGEEFAMILPDTGLIGATKLAESARAAVALLKIPHVQSLPTRLISISAGVAIMARATVTTPQQLIAAADQVLYEAKHQGRNCVVTVQAEVG